jgi:hypothetical protein
MRNLISKSKRFYFTIITTTLISNIYPQEIINTCQQVISGDSHGHVSSFLDCETTILITSTSEQNEKSIITGAFISTAPINITPGFHGVRLLPINHEDNDEHTGQRIHGVTHIKAKKPPTGVIGGRFIEFKKKQGKLIFPNPSKNKITVNSKKKISNIIIYNLYGSIVVKKDLQKSGKIKTTINILKLDEGFYTVKVLFANGTTKTETLIKV